MGLSQVHKQLIFNLVIYNVVVFPLHGDIIMFIQDKGIDKNSLL